MAGLVLMRAMNEEEILEIFEQAMTISNEHDVHLQRSRCSSLTVMVMGRPWAFPLSIMTHLLWRKRGRISPCSLPTTKRWTKVPSFSMPKSMIRRERPSRWNASSHCRVECQGSSKREWFVEFILIHEKNRMVALLAVAVNLFLAFVVLGAVVFALAALGFSFVVLEHCEGNRRQERM